MKTWGVCLDCRQLVRTRRDDGRMWTHSHPLVTPPYYGQRQWRERCDGSGKMPDETMERNGPARAASMPWRVRP